MDIRMGLIFFALLGFCLLLFNSAQQLLSRLRGLKTAARTSQTPPSCLSSGFSAADKPLTTTAAQPAEPATILPPQRRHVLSTLSHLNDNGYKYNEVTETEVLRRLLPMIQDYRTCQEERYTPTGFSVAEVRALGDFPDYAALSGVPLPRPYGKEFEVDKALARPYRPFRWAYHQTMSLTKMETDWWLELENTYKERIVQRKALFATHAGGVLDALPGSELACKELMEMVLQFYCARYPQHFSLVEKRIFKNKILRTEQDVSSKPPLEILMDNVPEDFGIMMRDDKTGNYFLRAAVICSSMGWNVASKVGLRLDHIHTTIPDYKEKMEFSMNRFFTKMPTDKPIQRGSWGLEVGQPLHVPPGDPHEKLRQFQDPNLRLGDCHLRTDWQTLRRLPLSGAIVFNFKALFTPVTEFRDEPCVPALVAEILREGKKNMMEHKGTWHVEHVVLPILDKWAREQEEDGLTPKNWEVATLDESPWFKGWEEKWHRQQGF